MSARVSKDHGFANSQRELQLAAVYAADRGVLKDIMEAADGSAVRTFVNIKKNEEPVVAEQPASDIAQTVILDLEKLHKLKQNFELLFVDGSMTSFQAAASDNTNEPVKEPAKPEKESRKSRKERIIELAKSVAGTSATEETQPATGLRSRRKRKDATDVLIDQIVTTKQEITPESEKQKEQIQIIDQFMRIQPSISGAKDKQTAPEDLSSIKTGDFGDAIISETLVEILLKQGKKEKAVEVLKKLIWKFPQKKAYFASQIEELKK
ncbi:MAG TPA: hypothetical protein VKZ68_05745 [Ohtaekwangia sp.]|nr:hypothetical protein [Ohtaekwangia sp.]